ncbi:MAG: GAF domain-containing sensor histidine kinase [Desulfobulbaceae bacterium]
MEGISPNQEGEGTSISSEALEQRLESMQQNLQALEKKHLKLEKDRKTYERLLDAAPDAILFVDRQGNILRVNAQMENVFRYKQGELDGRNIEILIPSRFHARHKEHLRNFFSHPRQRPMGSQFEIYGRRKDGEEFPADISLNFLDIDGVPYASASVRDVTERKAIDDKLIRDVHMQRVISEVLKAALKSVSLQEQLDSILELILSVPVLFLEEKGAIYLVNDDRKSLSLTALRGFDRMEELPCQDIIFGRCLCGEAAAQCRTIYADQLDDRHELIRDDMFSHGHYCVPIIDNQECVGLLNLYVKEGHKHNGSEEKFITVIADTTALVIRHHRNEKERYRLREKLAEEGKMAALGRMAANFAHQIRNPLTTIGGLARRLATLKIDGRGLKYADHITAEAARLELLLNNMFSYVQPPSLTLQKHDLAAVVEECLRDFSSLIKKRSVAVEKKYQPVPELLFDRKLVSLALENLLANALEAMPDGGRLALVVESEGEGKGSRAVVEVRDSGPGIPQDVMATIFEPFYTTKVGEKKVGLGLTIAKKIAKDHRGSIEIVSRPGSGTTAILTLPIAGE